MELKKYQIKVIDNLNHFLAAFRESATVAAAYQKYWEDQNVPVNNVGGMKPYTNILGEVPHVCFKVPTGGGKTFLACNALRPIFDAFPFTRTKVVVWLVPSDAILQQTVKNLSNPDHGYRHKINVDFSNRVEVYAKSQLLAGQNFNPTSVQEQLSILILSYDSFRSRSKEGRKGFQENGNLAQFCRVFGTPEHPIDGADETSLIQIINQLNPVVIVDEAYVDFGAESAMPLTEKYENLLVVQTFSKSRSMAGMRIGFAVGSPKLIRYLEDVKYSFNSYTMSRLALRCGAEAVRDRAYFEETTARIRETRERAKKILGEMGFVCTDSMANFLFAAHPEHRAADLFQALKEAGIYVRYFAKPRIDDYLRITVGTDQQMEVLYGFLRNYLSHREK